MTQLAEAFDNDLIITTAFQEARSIFESWASIGSGELPQDPIDAMQVLLMRWQVDRFGLQPDERMALGVIEEITEIALAESADEAYDGVGDVLVYGGQLACSNRLAIRPIIHLAEFLDGRHKLLGLHAQGILAQVVLKGAQKVRGLDDKERYQFRVTAALALAIHEAKTLLIASPGPHSLDVQLDNIYIKVGGEVAMRGAGHDAVPKVS